MDQVGRILIENQNYVKHLERHPKRQRLPKTKLDPKLGLPKRAGTKLGQLEMFVRFSVLCEHY